MLTPSQAAWAAIQAGVAGATPPPVAIAPGGGLVAPCPTRNVVTMGPAQWTPTGIIPAGPVVTPVPDCHTDLPPCDGKTYPWNMDSLPAGAVTGCNGPAGNCVGPYNKYNGFTVGGNSYFLSSTVAFGAYNQIACGQSAPAAGNDQPPLPPAPPAPTPAATVQAGSCDVHKWADIKQLALVPPHQTPRIGSFAWCQQLPQLKEAVKKAGGWLLQFSDGDVPDVLNYPVTAPQWLEAAFAVFGQSIHCFLDNLYATGVNIVNILRTVGRNALAFGVNMSRLMIDCDVELVTGLVLIKGVVSALKGIRVGVNAAAVGDVSITIQWDVVDAVIDYLVKSSCPYEIPGIGEAIQLYAHNRIQADVYNCWLLVHGANPDTYKPSLELAKVRPQGQDRLSMLHRLRPGTVPAGQEFTDEDYLESLQFDGMDADWIQRTYNLRYTPYTLREIRQLLDAGMIGAVETHAAFRDMGYDEEKAAAQTSMEMILTKRRRKAEIIGWTPARIARMYQDGVLDKDAVREKMHDLSYTAEQADEMIEVADIELKGQHAARLREQAITEYVQMLRQTFAEGVAEDDHVDRGLVTAGAVGHWPSAIRATWQSQAQLPYIRSAIAAIRKGWQSGFMPEVKAVELMELAGVTHTNALQIMGEWKGEASVNQHMLGVSEVLAGVKDGTISAPVALARLEFMGWAPAEAEILVMQSADALRQAELKHSEAAGKGAAQASKAAEALLRQSEAAAAKARAALKAITPVSSLKAWVKKAIISEGQFRERMGQLGYPADVVDMEYQDAMFTKPSKSKPTKQPHAAKGIPLSHYTPVGSLRTWLKKGLIGSDQFKARMEKMGYPDSVIDMEIAEVCGGKTAACVQDTGESIVDAGEAGINDDPAATDGSGNQPPMPGG